VAQLTILRYPDPRLYTVAKPVEEVDDRIRTLVRDLAATQVDVHLRVIVIDVSETRDQLTVLINPELLHAEGMQECEEGCLSVPGVYEIVPRAQKVKVRALGLDGKQYESDAEGLLALCIQHEMDHLEGKVFVDYLSRLKQTRIRAKLQKQQRRQAA
jgi:peptide deformylase